MTTRDKLEALAYNLWWSWNPEALELFKRLSPEAFNATNCSPIVALRHPRIDVISDPYFAADVDVVYNEFVEYMSPPSSNGVDRSVGYFCMEYGLHESLPLYSGGLGILAGDHIKAASDLGIPLVAVGLLLRDGYFKQHFNSRGWQQAEYPAVDVFNQPMLPVNDRDGDRLHISVELGFESVSLQAFSLDVGRVKLYLLDSDTEGNSYEHRHITRRLYAGNRKTRIQQEILHGIGGLRLLRAVGLQPEVYHLNEGHCGFVALELMREKMEQGLSRDEASQWVRAHTVFTTHTPVMAGHDRFDPSLFVDQMSGFAERSGIPADELLGYGRVNAQDNSEPFTMTVLGLNLANKRNGVSELNGRVTRAQWQHSHPNVPVEEVPIGHVTNGIHLETWTAPRAVPFLSKNLGDWHKDPSVWNRIWEVPDEDLWAYRCTLRKDLVDYATYRASRQTLHAVPNLDPEALTIGFARRFATYKRGNLVFQDLERALDLFSNLDRPVQLIFAGKAHPADDHGKWIIEQIYQMAQRPETHGKVVFLENYHMGVGRALISGADVWLNNPRRPHEASGTSGQKIAVHGGLNLSILDGWWPEGFNGRNGWSIGTDSSPDYRDPQVQDPEDAELLYRVLENEVIPAFYNRDEHGLPTAWLQLMREAMSTLPYQFSARRMVREYYEKYYFVDPIPTPVQV